MTQVSMMVVEVARRLAEAGVATPRADAELLVCHVLGVSRGGLAVAGPLSGEQSAQVRQLVSQRARRVPLQHLTGLVGFGRLELSVGPGVFVPRPETELLLEWALDRAGDARVVVDLCSGSGALALALAHELPAASVYAVERADAALAWLRHNAAQQVNAGDRAVHIVVGDATDPQVLAELDGTVDLVVCNPPYVPETVTVAPEVADHDPTAAVFAGVDGLTVIGPLISRVGTLLRPDGELVLEHDDTHESAVPALLRADGRFTSVTGHRDLAGRPRFATATRGAG